MFRPANQSNNRKENRWATSGKKTGIWQCPRLNCFLINLQSYFLWFLQKQLWVVLFTLYVIFFFRNSKSSVFPCPSSLTELRRSLQPSSLLRKGLGLQITKITERAIRGLLHEKLWHTVMISLKFSHRELSGLYLYYDFLPEAATDS